MHRRPLGRGRWLAAIAAAVILAGCFLPWWQFGGGEGLPPRTGNAFEASGILVVFVALATISLFTLPYATDRPVAIDRALSYAALTMVGWIGLVLRVVDLAGVGAVGLPDRAPGLWLSVLGLITLSRAVYEIARVPAYR
jgi:glycerol-3-phosphate acyltransferase PlsY